MLMDMFRAIPLLNRAVLKLDEKESAAELRALLKASPPARIVIDAGLPAGHWHIVRGLSSPQERAIYGAASGQSSAWADTVQM